MFKIKNKNDKKDEIIEKKQIEYNSLSASSNADDIEIYKPYIEKVLNEEESLKNKTKKNKNIAITGGYGAGKSSIIKSFFKDSNDVIYVSLGLYIEKNKKWLKTDNINENEIIFHREERIDQIETSILQQILYSVRPSKLPLSRINRIDKIYKFQNFFTHILSIIITMLIILFYIIKNNEQLYYILSDNFSLHIVFSIVLSFIYVIVYLIVSTIKTNFSFKKLSINGVELNTEESEISVLNRNIDELIHFFMQTDINKVVFEDIDRLDNCIEVFTKLKEINIILNSALNKSVQFIYAVGDSIFDNAEIRTKFFDAIIPIIPYSSFKSSRDLFNKPEFITFNFNKEIIKVICRYIDNPRIVYDIINEYTIYKRIMENSQSSKMKYSEDYKDELLVLCAYKVIYPQKFDLLLKGGGSIAYYLSNQFKDDLKNDFIEKEKEEISQIDAIIKSTRGMNTNLINSIIKILNEKIRTLKSWNSYEVKIIIKKNDEEITLLSNIANIDEEKINKIKNNEILFRNTSYSSQELTENIVFDFLTKEDFTNMLLFSNKYNNQNLELRKKDLQKKIETFNLEDISLDNIFSFLKKSEATKTNEFYKKDELNKSNIYYQLNEYEEWMIGSGYLKSNYRNMIIKNHGTSMTPEDEAIKEKILNSQENTYNDNVTDAKGILEEISYFDFSKDSVCIKKLFDYVLTLEEYDKYLNQFYLHFNINKLNFIIRLEKDNIKIFKKSKKYLEKLIYFIDQEKEKIEEKDIEFVICRVIDILDPINDKIPKYVITYLENTNNIEKVFFNNKNNLEKNLKNYPVSFKQKYFDPEYYGFYDYIVSNNMYGFNYMLLQSASISLDFNFSNKKILESIYSLKENNTYKNIYDYFFSNLENTIETSIKFGSQQDSEIILRKIIEDDSLNLTDDLKNKIIQNENIKYKDISWINVSLYDYLFKNDKVQINLENLNCRFIASGNILTEELITIIKNNNQILITQETPKNNLEIYEVLYNNELNYDLYKTIARIFENKAYVTSVPNVEIEKIKVLIEKNLIRVSDSNQMNLILDNNNLTEELKNLFIINNFINIDKLSDVYVTDKLISNVLDANIDKKEKTEFISKHLDKIVDSKSKLYSFVMNEKYDKSHDENIANKNIILWLIKNADIYLKDKINLFNKDYDLLENSIADIFKIFGEEYEGILSESTTHIDNNKENLELLEILRKWELITKYQPLTRRIRISYKTY